MTARKTSKTVYTDKLAVGSATPVTTQAAITAPTGGATIDAEARAAINLLITRLEAFGLVVPN